MTERNTRRQRGSGWNRGVPQQAYSATAVGQSAERLINGGRGMAVETPAGWYADPIGRYEHRYWDGVSWTENVATAGAQSTDPIVAPARPSVDVPVDVVASEPIAVAVAAGPASGFTTPAMTPQSAVATPPVKLCRHCQAQSATTSATCPTCGKPYVKKKKWPWVLAAVLILMAIGFAGCVAVVGTVASKAVDELNKEQARHAITPGQFTSVQLGTSRVDVVTELGKSPEDAQEFVQRGILNGQDLNSSCIYYNKAGGSFGDRYQFCFQNDSLSSKNAY